MSTVQAIPAIRTRSRWSNAALAAARTIAYCLGLLPLSLAALLTVLIGRYDLAAGWLARWRRLAFAPGRSAAVAEQAPTPDRPVGVAAHAAAGLLIGTVAIVPLGVLVLLIARGLLYGLVDHGPYDTSWGGPTMAGAWLAHFAIGIPFAAAAAVVLVGLARLHVRWGRLLAGERGNWWVAPVTVVLCAGIALFVRAWLHQL